MPLVNESNVIDDEDTRLADRVQILNNPLRADEPIAAAIEGPGAAKRAIQGHPRENSIEAQGSSVPRKYFGAGAADLALASTRRANAQSSGRSLSARSNRPGTARWVPRLDGRNEERHGGFALALQDAIDRACPMLDNRVRCKGALCPPNQRFPEAVLWSLSRDRHFGDVREVIAGKRDDSGRQRATTENIARWSSTCRSISRTWCPARRSD